MAIQLPPNSTGTIVDTVTLGGEDREVVVIGGNAAVAEESSVKNTAPAETVYGLVTRPILRKDGETLSTANLGVSGVFTQAWQDGAQDGVIFVEASARADQISASGGFVIEESDDSADSNFTRQVAAGTAAVNTLLSIRAAITRRFWRVVYTNGGTGQGSFRLTASATNVTASEFASADFNTDANNQNNVSMVGIALPGASGPVVGGTTTDPLIFTDDGNAILVDGSAVTQPISAASLPLPTGASTLGAQLPDGHAVTVDNAGAGAAVNVQDGGNSLTTDIGSSVSVEDSNNSTTTPLGISATFTGTSTDILNYSAVTVHIFADEDGATDGMTFEFSVDGTNWDIMHTHTYTASEGRVFQFAAHSQFFRMVFINGTTAQTVFRVQTLLHPNTKLTTIHRLVDTTSPDRSASLIKSAIIAQAAGTGDFIPVQATAAGNFKVAIEEADGNIQGGGTEATALRVTVANDSTGVLTVDQPTAANLNATVVATALDIRALTNADVVTAEAGAGFPAVATDAGAHGASQTGLRAMGTDGTNDQQIAVDATGNLQVDVLTVPANQTIDLAQIGATTVVTGGVAGTLGVGGLAAADAPVAGNPNQMGARASSTEPSEMSTNGDAVPLWADRFGRLIVTKNFPSDVSAAAHGPVTITKTTTAIEDVVAAPAAGQSIYVTALSASNTSATGVRLDISDGATIRYPMFLAASGGGYVMPFDPPWELTAATALRATASAAVTDIRVNAHFFIMPDSTA